MSDWYKEWKLASAKLEQQAEQIRQLEAADRDHSSARDGLQQRHDDLHTENQRLADVSECFTKVWQYLESEHKEIADEIQTIWVNGDMDLFVAAPPQKGE